MPVSETCGRNMCNMRTLTIALVLLAIWTGTPATHGQDTFAIVALPDTQNYDVDGTGEGASRSNATWSTGGTCRAGQVRCHHSRGVGGGL